jgi:NADPH:quinone reductase-like Zn-dependent oxidoreductase
VRKPNTVTFEQAAGIPLAGVTAWKGLVEIGQLREGQRVLIYGGSGGVGSFAVQIAKARGAWVVTTCSPRSREVVETLGADEVIYAWDSDPKETGGGGMLSSRFYLF